MNRPGFNIPVLLAIGFLAKGACAQCTMSVQFSAQSNCGGLFWAVTSIANGTPPYDAVAYHGNGTVATFTDVQASALVGGEPQGGYDAAHPGTYIIVTDALGCTAQGSAMTPAVHAVLPALTLSLDCNTALGTVRCTGFTDAYDSGFPYAPCDWAGRPCSLDGTSVGTVATSWVNEGGGIWRYGQALAPGSHIFGFTGTNLPCGNALECWGPMTVIVPTITPGDCGVNFRLRAALDGALPSGTLMTDGLRSASLIPVAQPYTALGYTFVGSPTNVTITPAQLAITGNDAIVDWVVVELRSSLTTIAYSKPALLQRDGDVIDTDGNDYLNFPIAAGSYHVALRHRNHLAVMTSTTKALTVNPSANLIDFRSASTGTYGTNARVLKGSVQCLWTGDATGNGTLKYTGTANDRDPLLIAVGSTTPNNSMNNVYDRRDTNLDGVIKYTGSGNDRDIILTNVGSTTPNNTRTQQLP